MIKCFQDAAAYSQRPKLSVLVWAARNCFPGYEILYYVNVNQEEDFDDDEPEENKSLIRKELITTRNDHNLQRIRSHKKLVKHKMYETKRTQ